VNRGRAWQSCILIKGFPGREFALFAAPVAILYRSRSSGLWEKIHKSPFFFLESRQANNHDSPRFAKAGGHILRPLSQAVQVRHMGDKETRERKLGKAVRSNGIALAIPMVMVSFPLIAGLIGKYLADRFEMPWIVVVMVILGLVLAVREAIRLVQQLNKTNE
jgi:F0F1-type ATP synthase assembly protein I